MAFRRPPRNRQAQAVALGGLAGGAVERLAQLAEVLGVNPGAVIADGYFVLL